jgi:hypothetical protein
MAFTVHPWAYACGHTSFGNPATKADTPGTGDCPAETPPSYCPAGDVAGDATASFELGTLTLSKNGPTCDLLAAGATIQAFTRLTAASFDLVTGSYCGAGAPRLNVVTSDHQTHFFGCSANNVSGHVSLNLSAAGDGSGNGGVLGKTVTAIDFVQDEMGTAMLKNLTFQGIPAVVSREEFGPFAGGSPDSGTCGNNWANDTYQRTFTVTTMPDGTQTLRQDYTAGFFTTVAGKSPGACEGEGGDNGGTVVAGITGEFHGFTSGTLTCGEGLCPVPNPGTVSPECSVPNVTACFVNAIFGPNAVFSVSTFKFNYTAGCGYFLAERAWQNADAGTSGGNRGDIKSAPGAVDIVPCPPAPAPPATSTATPTPTPTVSPSGLPGTGPSTSPASTAAVSHLASTGGGSGVPWSGLALLLGLGLLLALGGGVVVARTQFRRF